MDDWSDEEWLRENGPDLDTTDNCCPKFPFCECAPPTDKRYENDDWKEPRS